MPLEQMKHHFRVDNMEASIHYVDSYSLLTQLYRS